MKSNIERKKNENTFKRDQYFAFKFKVTWFTRVSYFLSYLGDLRCDHPV